MEYTLLAVYFHFHFYSSGCMQRDRSTRVTVKWDASQSLATTWLRVVCALIKDASTRRNKTSLNCRYVTATGWRSPSTAAESCTTSCTTAGRPIPMRGPRSANWSIYWTSCCTPKPITLSWSTSRTTTIIICWAWVAKSSSRRHAAKASKEAADKQAREQPTDLLLWCSSAALRQQQDNQRGRVTATKGCWC